MTTPTTDELTIARLEREKKLLLAALGSYNKAMSILYDCVERNKHVITVEQTQQLLLHAQAGLRAVEAVNDGV